MSSTTSSRTARRLTAVTAVALTASFALAAPASAHVEVEAEGARALAENVIVSFNAETESDTAGITKLEVVLPEGIAPTDVAYKDGPAGWKLSATDRGYTVSGPSVAVGKDAAYSVVVRQLPDAESVAFKTLQSYSDGRIDRWIELEKSSDGGHGNPAPMLELKAAAAGAKPVSPSPSATAAESPSAAASESAQAETPTAPKEASKAAKEDDSVSPLLFVVLGILVVAAVGVGLWWMRRRGDDEGTSHTTP